MLKSKTTEKNKEAQKQTSKQIEKQRIKGTGKKQKNKPTKAGKEGQNIKQHSENLTHDYQIDIHCETEAAQSIPQQHLPQRRLGSS